MSTVRILLLGFYYPPDISAGAFRTEALVRELALRLPEGSELQVITTMPNRYGNGDAPPPRVEAVGKRVTVTRLSVRGGGRGMAPQALAFMSYALQVGRLVRSSHYDLVIATFSRLMTAVLGRWVAKRQKARLYQDVRDNFVDNLPYVLPSKAGILLAPLFAGLEHWALTKADKVNLVSRGFTPYFQSRYPHQYFSWHTNGIDPLFVEAAQSGVFARVASSHEARPLQVLYAGNLGAGQGIERILPLLAQQLAGRAAFTVIGAGAGREPLQRALLQHGIDNVQLCEPVAREALLDAYRNADVLFLHLNTLPSLENVLPSKLFEYAATGRPVWAGVAGFPAQFVSEEIDNAAVFTPGDVDAAVAALEQLTLHSHPRSAFIEKWRRDNIMDEMACEILALVNNET